MREANILAPVSAGRFGMFAAASFLLAQALFYVAAFQIRQPLAVCVPVIAVALLCLSTLFGLWKRQSGLAFRASAVLWSVLAACSSPVLFFIVLTVQCAALNSAANRYVCGL